MTDEEFNRRFELIGQHLESVAQSLGQLESAQERDREQHARDLELLKGSTERVLARVDRLERVVRLAVRAGLRERRDTREKINALIDSQVRLEQALADSSARLEQGLADSSARLERGLAESNARADASMADFRSQVGQALAEMTKAITATNRRVDEIGGNGWRDGNE